MAIKIHPIQQRLANKGGRLFPAINPLPSKFPADKGKYRGHCNRSACLAPNPVWFNHSMNAYYCSTCADLLNKVAYADKCHKEPMMELKLDGSEDPEDWEHEHNVRMNDKWQRWWKEQQKEAVDDTLQTV